MKISDETKVGIFAVFTLVLLLFGLNMLKGRNIFIKNVAYYAVYDNITGIRESNPVLINGHQVGKIYRMELDMEKQEVLVVLSVRRFYNIPKGSIAKIIDMDILGAKAIELILSDNSDFHSPNDTLETATATSLTSAIEEKISPVLNKIDEALAKILSSLLDENGQNNLKQTMDNLKATSDNIKTMTDEMNNQNVMGRFTRIVANVESISKNLKENNENISNFMQNLSTLSDSIDAANLAETINKANQLVGEINDIMLKINQGEGSLGLLVNDTALYNNLDETSKNLNLLLLDLKNKPGRYVHFSVFGKSDKQKGDKESKEKK